MQITRQSTRSRGTNELIVPTAASALDQMKYEIAAEFGVQLGPDTTSERFCGRRNDQAPCPYGGAADNRPHPLILYKSFPNGIIRRRMFYDEHPFSFSVKIMKKEGEEGGKKI